MQDQITVYFQSTFSQHFSQRLSQLLTAEHGKETFGFLPLLALESQMDQLFRNQITRKTYLQTLGQIIAQSCSEIRIEKSPSKNELQKKISLMTLCLRIEQEMRSGQESMNTKLVAEVQIVKVINQFKLICQLESQFAFETYFEQLLVNMREVERSFRQRMLKIFSECQIDSASFLHYLSDKSIQQKPVKVAGQSNIKSQTKFRSQQVRCQKYEKNHQSQLKSPMVSNRPRQLYSPMTSGKSQATAYTSLGSSGVTNLMKRTDSPSGRTIFMAHPMKYIKKQRQKVKKVYHYVECSCDIANQ